MAIRVAVDAMGGDDAPGVVVEGAVQAARHPDAADIQIQLFGLEDDLQALLATHPGAADLGLSVHHAPEVVGMAESPVAAVKQKRNSSIHLGLAAHKSGAADAFVSAGNTGAVMAAALFILGRLPDVARPTLVGFFPTTKGHCIVVDVGSNMDCKPDQLLQFGQMGAVYAERIMQRQQPVVALMNVGEEPGKGNEASKEAFDLLSNTPDLNFRGNIEGRDLLLHAADVVVCDGFVGNILLKFGESIATGLPVMLAQEMHRQQLGKAEQALVGRVFHGVKQQFNYEEYGGAPLLGVDGNILIGHGGSSPLAIERLILAAAKMAARDVAGAIAGAVSSH